MSNETYNSYLDAEGLALVLSCIRDKINAAAKGITNTKGKANGIASLDAGGNVPLSQLGNLDTTFFEIVTELPTDIRNIKKHIYILKDSKDGENNKYAEYIYTGDLTDAGDLAGDVDASNWEKLGDFVPSFDLQEYVKKAGAVAKLEFYDPVWDNTWNSDDDQPSETAIRIEFADGSHKYLVVPDAVAPTNTSRSNSELSDSEKSKPFISPGRAGFMSAGDKGKLDKIDVNALTASINAANTAADNVNTAINKAENAATGAEKVNATITEENVFEVTDRTGVKKTLDMSGMVSAQSDVARIQESMGAYSDRPDITLVAKETNKAISADGVKVTKTGWAIAEFTAELGNIYLFNPGETSSDVCVFAEYIDKVETRAIDYAYTYDESGRVITAKATYNGKTYTYTYDYSTDEAVITDQNNKKVSSLPSVYTTTVGAYNPMTILNTDAELPKDGYCRFVSNFTTASSIKIVVSYKVNSANLAMKVVRDGSTANMCSQLAKINKKVDDIADKQVTKNKIFIHTCKEGGVIQLDNKDILLEARKSYSFENFTSFRFKGSKTSFNRIEIIGNPSCYTGYNLSAFSGCSHLTFIDVSRWDTSNININSSLCTGCMSLRNINIDKLNTSKVTNMLNMFATCTSLTSLDVSGWDTSNVTNMLNMFRDCTSLTFLDVSGWDTSKVTNMSELFGACASLTSLDVSGWDTSKVTNMLNMFRANISIVTLIFGENFGKMQDAVGTLDLSAMSVWTNSSVKSLLTLYDRKANGLGVITIKLHANTKAALGEDGIAQLTAKGYTIA